MLSLETEVSETCRTPSSCAPRRGLWYRGPGHAETECCTSRGAPLAAIPKPSIHEMSLTGRGFQLHCQRVLPRFEESPNS